MKTFLRDLRHGVRVLGRNPGFTAVTVLTLGLGIGAVTAMWSVVDGVLLAPLPYPEPDRLMMIWNRFTGAGLDQLNVSGPELEEYQEGSTVFEGISGFMTPGMTLMGEEEPEHVLAGWVSANFFDVLGVGAKPGLGRTFTPEEGGPSEEAVVVLGHALWQRLFGGDPGVVGGTIKVNGASATVVGVMPPGFDFPDGAEIWTPITVDPANPWPREMHNMRAIARTKPGVSPERAAAEMETLAARLQQEHPESYPKDSGWGATAVPLAEQMVGDVRPRLLVLLAAVGFLLLIACANVANLLLARGQSREREVALRTALGASRTRLVGQFVTETALLALLGGLLGVLLARWGLAALPALAPEDVPRLDEVGLDLRALGVALAVSLATGLLLGLVPALQSRADLTETFKQAGGRTTAGTGRRLARRFLVVAETAVALVLVIGAVLASRSFLALSRVDPGFDPSGTMTLKINLPHASYTDAHRVAQFYGQLMERVAVLPGAVASGAISQLPLSGAYWSGSFSVESNPLPEDQMLPEADLQAVTSGYFTTLGISRREGRDFGTEDHAESTPVAIVDQQLADRYWPGRSALGQRVKFGGEDSPNPWLTIVGVVESVKNQSLDGEARVQIYFPHAQNPAPNMFITVRTAGDPETLAEPLRQAVTSTDREVPVTDVATMEERLSESLGTPRFSALLLAAFAVVALVLAAVGIYGVIAYSVAERTQELGVRMALGAERRDVVRLVVRQGMMLALLGLAVGLAIAFALTRFLSSQLYGVGAADPLAFAGVALLLAAVALVASWLPARRATKVDPVVALRYE